MILAMNRAIKVTLLMKNPMRLKIKAAKTTKLKHRQHLINCRSVVDWCGTIQMLPVVVMMMTMTTMIRNQIQIHLLHLLHLLLLLLLQRARSKNKVKKSKSKMKKVHHLHHLDHHQEELTSNLERLCGFLLENKVSVVSVRLKHKIEIEQLLN